MMYRKRKSLARLAGSMMRTRKRLNSNRSQYRHLMKYYTGPKRRSTRQNAYLKRASRRRKCRTRITINAQNSQDSRTVYSDRMINIPHTNQSGTPDPDAIDRRQRDAINVSGFKIDFMVRNNSTEPLIFHYAIIVNKHDDNAGPTTTDFFRWYGNARAKDADTLLSSINFNDPINTDRYAVYRHKKLTLNELSTSTTYDTDKGTSWRKVSMFLPWKKEADFASKDAIYPELGNVYFSHWADKPLIAGGTAVSAGAYSIQLRCVTYFKDID